MRHDYVRKMTQLFTCPAPLKQTSNKSSLMSFPSTDIRDFFYQVSHRYNTTTNWYPIRLMPFPSCNTKTKWIPYKSDTSINKNSGLDT